MKHSVSIEYCTKCGWMLRAAWMAQEILHTFEEDLESVALKPGTTGGVFQICVDGVVLLDRKVLGHFPDIKEVKQSIRDTIDPERSLGHTDR